MLTHVDDDGEQRILLTDFGIARYLDDISGLTTTNMTVGTVAYSAPEQLMGKEIDGRADQYALAATTYHLLTGTQLFPHSNPAVVISRHLNSPPPALSDIRPELSALDPVLLAALAKNPNERLSRCSDFARALAEQSPLDGKSSSSAPTTPAPQSRKALAPTASEPPAGSITARPSAVRPRQWLVPVAALAVIAVASAVALAWRPWESRHSTAQTTAIAPSPTASPMTSFAAPPPLPPPAPPPPPPVFPASAIDNVLLTAAEISKLLGIDVTNKVAGAPGVVTMD